MSLNARTQGAATLFAAGLACKHGITLNLETYKASAIWVRIFEAAAGQARQEQLTFVASCYVM